jgi:hypothetical protein
VVKGVGRCRGEVSRVRDGVRRWRVRWRVGGWCDGNGLGACFVYPTTDVKRRSWVD